MLSFRTLLVANRGEIAVRILRTAHRMGLRTVAVYSDADAGAPHVRQADEAVRLGPAPASQSYLSIDRLLEAARVSGADAVHPGYGFLAEHAEFARRCREAGLVFVGPPADAIAAMADKVSAKERLRAHGVPMLDGAYPLDADAARTEAERIGWPLFIKAAAGGGGRGMRRVDDPSQFDDAYRSAASEALQSFSDGRLFLERCLDRARHVEIQVFADTRGRVVALGERECSVQRRHQKLIEETPSPAVDPILRGRMEKAAIAAVEAIEYRGAGTVEFLLDPQGDFHFLEVNTRLQVEHPVTEMVRDLDLVELQLREASGEDLVELSDLPPARGHAIEARLCAEDVQAGFLPAPGPIYRWIPPEGPGIRVDAGVSDRVPGEYDPMVAKIVAWGPNREIARLRLIRALEDTVLLGVVHNRDFLLQVLKSEVFAVGELHTGMVDAGSWKSASDEAWPVAAALWAHHRRRDAHPGPRSPYAHPFRLADGERERTFWASYGPKGEIRIRFEDQGASTLHLVSQDEDGRHRMRTESLDRVGWAHFEAEGLQYSDRRGCYRFHVPRSATSRADEGGLNAPLPGKVVAVPSASGSAVQKGDVLVIIESMKIEHSIRSPRNAVVARVHVEVGQQVSAGDELVELEAS